MFDCEEWPNESVNLTGWALNMQAKSVMENGDSCMPWGKIYFTYEMFSTKISV